MHSKNAFHIDIKLENILYDSKSGEIKISDFGLSVLADDSKATFKTKWGTPCYTAPEMFMSSSYYGQPPGVWSCGVILYIMLSGKYPFEAKTLNGLISIILKRKVSYPKSMPSGAVDLLKKIFIVDSKKRATIENIKNHPWFKNNKSNSRL